MRPVLPQFPAPRPAARRAIPWLPLALVGCAVFLLAALTYYHLALAGSTEDPGGLLAAIVASAYGLLGFVPGFMLALLLLAWGTIWFLGGGVDRIWSRLLRILVLTVSLAILVNLEGSGASARPHDGWLGHELAIRFVDTFGTGFSAVVVSLLALASLLLATDFFFYRHFEALPVPLPSADAGVEPEVTDQLRGLRDDLSHRTIWHDDPFSPLVAPLSAPDHEPELEPGSTSELAPTPRSIPLSHFRPEPPLAPEAVEPDLDYEVEPEPEPAPESEPESEPAVEPPNEPDLQSIQREPERSPTRAGEAPVREPLADLETSPEPDSMRAPSTPAAGAASELEPASEPDLEPEPEPGTAGKATDASESIDAADPQLRDSKPEPEPEPGVAGGAGDAAVLHPPPPAGRQRTLFLRGAPDPALLDEAARVVIHSGRATAALLQRRLRIGYEESAELLDALRRAGVIDGEPGAATSRPRIDLAEWEQR